jgi:glycosyltransferase involved in cell wall biosynthesis
MRPLPRVNKTRVTLVRLLMLNNEYPPIGGGTATANYYVIREMARRGLAVDLVTSTPMNSRFESYHIGENARVFRVPIDNRNPHYQSERELLNYIYHAFGFIRTLYRGTGPTYDLCHAWSGLPAGALALLLKWKRHLPYIVGLRGSDVPGYDVRYKYLYPFLKIPLSAIWRSASAITANSHELRELSLRFRPQEIIEVIPNGVDLQRFHVADLTTSRHPLRVLCVARLVERKGISDLINAFHNALQTRPDMKLILVGRGDREKEYHGQVQHLQLTENVEFLGAVEHQKIPEIYQEADLFVLPSWHEGMSNAILEAIASGLPIITTYTGGTAETLRGNGILVPMHAPDALAKAILELANNQALRIQMGKRSHEIAETLVWEHVAEAYIELYNRTLAAVGSSQRVPTS